MQESIKVLFLITKSNWGGAQRYVFDLASNLPKDSFDVVVALGGDGVLITKLEDAGVRVIRIPGLQRDISFKKELFSFWSIAKIIREERPDVLHVNSSKAGGIGAFCGRMLGVQKIVYTAHGWAFNEDRGPLSRFVVGFFHWLTILFAHKTIAVSHTLETQMKWPFTRNKMVIVHNGRNAPRYLTRESAREYLLQHEPRLQNHLTDIWTGTIAELHPIKGHDVMLEAVAQMVASGNQLCHLIFGNGELHEQLTQKIQEMHLTEHVFLLGHHDEASQYLKAFDIFTLSSHSEGLAYVMIEAAQAGLPIVATRVGGIPEIITDASVGMLVPPNSPSAFKDALVTLLNDPQKRQELGEMAQKKGAQFSLHNMLEDTLAVYKS